MHMSGTRTQVDYILIRNKWKNSVKNCEAYNTFSSVGSDHRILTATLKLSLRVTKKQPRGNVYDWTALRNPDLQRAYTIAVRNRFEGLSVEGESVTDSYQHFIQANEEASSQLLPKRKPRKKSNKSSNPRIVKAREKVTTAFNTYALSPTADNHVTLQNENVYVYVYVCTSRSSWVFINLTTTIAIMVGGSHTLVHVPAKCPPQLHRCLRAGDSPPVSFPPGSPVDSMYKVLQGGGITGFVELLSSTRALRRSQESNDQPRLYLLFFPTLGLFLFCPSFKPPGRREGPCRKITDFPWFFHGQPLTTIVLNGHF